MSVHLSKFDAISLAHRPAIVNESGETPGKNLLVSGVDIW